MKSWLRGADFVVFARQALTFCVARAGHNNVTCADYGCYAQWKDSTAEFL
jgi:hypothetical protein